MPHKKECLVMLTIGLKIRELSYFIFKLILLHLFIYLSSGVCMRVCMHTCVQVQTSHGIHLEVTRQLAGAHSLHPLCRSCESNSGHQAWWQSPLPTEFSNQSD